MQSDCGHAKVNENSGNITHRGAHGMRCHGKKCSRLLLHQMFHFIYDALRELHTLRFEERRNHGPLGKSLRPYLDVFSDALPFGRLWYDTSDNAIGYAMHSSRSHDAMIRVYDVANDMVETLEHKGEFEGF